MSIIHQIYQNMYRATVPDEPVCSICQGPIELNRQLIHPCLCQSCADAIQKVKKVYKIHGIYWYVLYAYNDFLERLWFQLKEQKDIVLASIFLAEEDVDLRSYCLCAMPSSEQKRMVRGFEPIIEVFKSTGMEIYSPFYKTSDLKQSNQPKSKRQDIQDVLELKTCYWMPDKPILLVDDVCTTGATLSKACTLLSTSKVFIISAHPLWMASQEPNEVANAPWIW